jgi:hypothetical protein
MGLGTQASSGAGAGISMIPSSTLTNWFVGSNYVNSGAFEIIPSTAGGGSTFSTPALVLNSSGNLGLGIAPSAFGATYKAFQPTGYAAYVGDSYYGRAEILNNAYASNINVFNYFDTNSAGRYSLQLGVHAWYNAPSGTAGDTITFSQVMTLDASGNLGLGTTSPFSAANQTSLTINATTYPRLDFYSGGTQRAFINSGSTDTNIYTVGATPLTFGTNNTERARIDSSGNVGIGTSSPSKKLDVYLGTTGTVEQYLRNNTINLLSKIDGTTSAQFGTETSHPLVFLTGNTERARITSGGDFGIGTSSPAQTLHVKTSTSATPITLGVLSNATGLPALSFNGAYASTTMAGIYSNGGTATSLYYEVPSGQNHFFGIADVTKMTLDSSGNLGLGVTNPSVNALQPQASNHRKEIS